jgi:hypothetical protein
MSLVSWLRNPKRFDVGKRIRTPASPRKRSTFRPQLEALEDRWMPSALTVTNNLDSGKGSLRYEIAHVTSGRDTIVFAPSLDGQTITLTSGELDITKNLTIQGPGAGLLTISSNSNLYSYYHNSRVFEVAPNTTVTLSGLTISNGDAQTGSLAYFGGDILNQGTLTLSGCTVSASVNDVYTFEITIPGAMYGGGIYNAPGATLTVSACTISGNSANYGGGIYNSGTLTVSNSVFSGNYPDNIFGSYTDGGGNTFS